MKKKILASIFLFLFVFSGCSRLEDAAPTSEDTASTNERRIPRLQQQAISEQTAEEILDETEPEEVILPVDDVLLQQSRGLYPEEFAILDVYDIDDIQKLSIILMAHYLNIQERIDLDEIAALNPMIEESVSVDQGRDSLIEGLLGSSGYALLDVEESELQDGVLTFNPFYQLWQDYNSNLSVLHTKQIYFWVDGRWSFQGDENMSENILITNVDIVIKRGEIKEFFGVDNLLDLFDFKGDDYRAEYSEKYGLPDAAEIEYVVNGTGT